MDKTLIIFDIDDTLTKSAQIHIKAFIASLNDLGVSNMDTNFGEYLHHTDSYISKTIYEKVLWKTFTEEIKVQFEKLLTAKMAEETITEVSGATEFIKQLKKDSSIAICYATGSLRRPAIQKLKSIGVGFDSKVLAASDTYLKRESIIKNAIKGAKEFYEVTDFKRIISVGDGFWDLKAANNLGLEFIGIGEKNKEMLIENGCEKWFVDFTQLKVDDLVSK